MSRLSNRAVLCLVGASLSLWAGCYTVPVLPPTPVAESPFQVLARLDISTDHLYQAIAEQADAEGFTHQLERQSELAKPFTPSEAEWVRQSFLRSLKVMLFDLAPAQFWERHLVHYYAARMSESDAQVLVEEYERDVLAPTSRLRALHRSFVDERVPDLLPTVRARSFRIEISQDAMVPTLLPGDHLLVHKAAYHTVTPERHDIVVYRYPDEEGKRFLHRVIGIPGDRIEIRDQMVMVNGQPISESSVQHTDRLSMIGNVRDNLGPVIVPPERYFLLGDNREESLDSRFLGPISKEHILGKGVFIYWSVDPNTRIPRWARLNRSVQ